MKSDHAIKDAAVAVTLAIDAGYSQTEIAQKAGYSQPIVGQVMRRSDRNAPTTRANILQAALELAENPKEKKDYSRSVESFRRLVHPAIVCGFSRSRLGVEAGYNEDYIPYLLNGHGPNGRVPDIAYRRVKKIVDKILNGGKTAEQPINKPGNSILHSRRRAREKRRLSCTAQPEKTQEEVSALDAWILQSPTCAATAAASSRPEHWAGLENGRINSCVITVG